MARVMKPPSEYNKNDTDTGVNWYDGPPPVPGYYEGVVKKLLLTKTSSGEQRIMVLCEISEGQYKGAGVTKWLQLTEQGSPWVNQFLHSLTDGSEQQKKAIRDAFNDIGYEVGDMDDKKRLPIIKIGKKTNPIGMRTAFVTKMRTSESDGITRAEISRFVVPSVSNGNKPAEAPEEDALDDYDASGMDEFSSETTSNPHPEELDDDADPWS